MRVRLVANAVCLLVLLMTGCGLDIRRAPTPTPATPKERTLVFAKAILEIEHERDAVVQDFQTLSQRMMDMSTREVFAKADSLVQRQRDLYGKLVLIQTAAPTLRPIRDAFESAYVVELRGYEALAVAVRAGDSRQILAASLNLLKADDLYLLAYDKLESRLTTFGLTLSDVR